MRLYLDMCCLKRPFDDQSQPRIAMESAALLAVFHAIEAGQFEVVRSSTHDAENAANPDERRRAAVQAFLNRYSLPDLPAATVEKRFREFLALGGKPGDCLHLAWAEHAGAEVFVTVDAGLLTLAQRGAARIRVRVMDPVRFVREFLQ